MFAAGYFAKTFFTGSYFAPNSTTIFTPTETEYHSVLFMVNVGRMMNK
jgi:hypothetical protein